MHFLGRLLCQVGKATKSRPSLIALSQRYWYASSSTSGHDLTKVVARELDQNPSVRSSSAAAAREPYVHSPDNILHPDYRGVDNPYIYDDAHSRSVNNPTEFWAAAAEDIVWTKKWDKVIDNSNEPFTKWFAFQTFLYLGISC